jgi:hypothetical protein
LSIVRYSNEHKVSGTGSVSILIWGDSQWLQLTHSNGVGVSHLFKWGWKQNQLPKCYLFLWHTSNRTTAMLLNNMIYC